MADIFDSYQMAAAWDEMFERPGVPRGLRLEYADIGALLDELPAHLRALQHATAACSAAVTSRYFERASPVTWAHEEV